MRRTNARGMSLVELLIGIVLALLIAAAAAMLLASSQHENRRLLLEARVTQELRSTVDLITREARRAGYWGSAATSGLGSSSAGTIVSAGAIPNPYAVISPDTAASDAITLRYSQDSTAENGTVDSNEQFGFRLRGSGTIEAQLGASNWQALTDPATLVVTRLLIEPRIESVELESACSLACAGAPSCAAPRVQVRSLVIAITAHAAGDAAVSRSQRTTVRLRNDHVSAGCAA